MSMYHKRIRRIAVEGFYDLYDHDVPLNAEERVTILHGPNGVGKTNLLWMLRFARLRQLSNLHVQFKRFIVDFDDGSQIDWEPGTENTFDTPIVYFDPRSWPSVDDQVRQAMEDARRWGATERLKGKIVRFEDRLNSRLVNKTVSLSPEDGFSARGNDGRKLGPGALSFGERILIDRTALSIFGMPAGGLMLLTEPEYRSHVIWQQQVVPDLLEDAKEDGYDVLFTTYSPDIIGPYEHLSVGLSGAVRTK